MPSVETKRCFLKVEFSDHSYKEVHPEAAERGHWLLPSGHCWTSQTDLSGDLLVAEKAVGDWEKVTEFRREKPQHALATAVSVFLKNVPILWGVTYIFTPPHISTSLGRPDCDCGNTKESYVSHAFLQSKTMLLALSI